MPITQAQAHDKFIYNSLAQFLTRTVKAKYDPRVASLTDPVSGYPTPLKILAGSPDDDTIVLNPPVIAINDLTISSREASYAIGDPTLWRAFNFVLYCYPSLDNAGNPSKDAAFDLRSLMKNALGTESIRIVDYTATPTAGVYPFTGEVMYLDRVSGPMPRGGKTSIAQERHRFDFNLHVRYPVIETLDT